MSNTKITPHFMKSPDSDEILSMRKLMCLTRDQAAALTHVSPATWRQWENGQRVMGEAYWDLFLTKVTILQAIDQLKMIIPRHPLDSPCPVLDLTDIVNVLQDSVV